MYLHVLFLFFFVFQIFQGVFISSVNVHHQINLLCNLFLYHPFWISKENGWKHFAKGQCGTSPQIYLPTVRIYRSSLSISVGLDIYVITIYIKMIATLLFSRNKLLKVLKEMKLDWQKWYISNTYTKFGWLLFWYYHQITSNSLMS